MVSWDLAERVIDASSSGCRENLQHALEDRNGVLSPVCRAEVGRVLQDIASPHAPEAIHSGVRDDSKGSKQDDKSNAEGTVTIVLTFVSCVLVAVAAFAYCVGGGRTVGGRQMRGGRRLPKKTERGCSIVNHAKIAQTVYPNSGLSVPFYDHNGRNRSKRGSGRGARSGDSGERTSL